MQEVAEQTSQSFVSFQSCDLLEKLNHLVAKLSLQSKAVNVGCTYSNGMTVWRMAGLYGCEASVFFFGRDRIVLEVSQNHLAGKTNRHVTALNVRNQNIGFPNSFQILSHF
jgi:hypothetical protein